MGNLNLNSMSHQFNHSGEAVSRAFSFMPPLTTRQNNNLSLPSSSPPPPLLLNTQNSSIQGHHQSNNPNNTVATINGPNSMMRQHPIDLGLQDPSVITSYLLLGGAMVNKNPELVNYLGITHVVNMAVELMPHMELIGKRSMVYKHIRSDDSLQYNIRVHFEEAFDIIDDARSNNGRVLVHCMMGISRSGIL